MTNFRSTFLWTMFARVNEYLRNVKKYAFQLCIGVGVTVNNKSIQL